MEAHTVGVEPAGEVVCCMTPDQCRAARKKLGWSQAGLARRAGVSTGVISAWENNRHVPLPANMARILLAFHEAGVDVDEP